MLLLHYVWIKVLLMSGVYYHNVLWRYWSEIC